MPDSQITTIYEAREILTVDKNQTRVKAVAVRNDRIVATGSVRQIKAILEYNEQEYRVDKIFENHIIVPGFISQHDHPLLAGVTMSSVILAIEDWELPNGTSEAVKDKTDFMTRLCEAEKELDGEEPLLSWGYHAAFYGPLTRMDLDEISEERPVFVWGRSCHEIVLNTAAMTASNITEAVIACWPESAQEQCSYENAHFWEQGLFAALLNIAPVLQNPEKFREGLKVMRDYMHSKGITYGNEPGGILSKDVQDSINDVMSEATMPFRWSFIPDGKSIIADHDDDDKVIEETEALEDWYHGMTSMVKKSVKLFSDGAIYSLAIQLRDPYIDEGYHGEWMMDKEVFERAFRVYWDADYQLHIHVNGDAGLDRVLDTLEKNMVRKPRYDHRSVMVHFAVSQRDQIDRIRRLGAIVSGNPYYVNALADRYSETGLGPRRANTMVRLGDLYNEQISWSLHSDMPMAPADPLLLMWAAVNRITTSGRQVGRKQCIPVEEAMRGVTIEAAYSHRLENEIGSIEQGKLANFTILEENPYDVDPLTIKDIGVWGTVLEGRVQKVGEPIRSEESTAQRKESRVVNKAKFAYELMYRAVSVVHSCHSH